MSQNTESEIERGEQGQRKKLRELRHRLIEKYKPLMHEGAGPIRVMAAIVSNILEECKKEGIDPVIVREEVVNRTIGDVNLRLVTECIGEEGGEGDYRMLADEIGVAMPGENIGGYIATGEAYLWLKTQMQENERLLLKNNYDPRMYDIYGVGNPLLRTWLAEEEMGRWGFHFTQDQLYLSLGAMDGLDRSLRGLAFIQRNSGNGKYAILFPEPSFGVPEWQARTHGYRLINHQTTEENRFKLTGQELDQLLQENEDLKVVYLTVSNNPTTFAYTPEELDSILGVVRKYRQRGRIVYILADLAYIGTGKPEEDRARMASFHGEDILKQIIFVCSFSKTFSLTGERFGWVICADKQFMVQISSSWTNSIAALPGEWQLRFMAYYQLLQARPWLGQKMRNFYRMRRQQFIEQLREINEGNELFEEIYLDDDATVYNWSKMRAGVDTFSLFEQTGIAGVPGSGFGYTDQYIRFSIGVLPIRI